MAVIAAAGSGKTRVLIERIHHLVKEKKVNPASILAITFTRKAAGELRERLAKLEITGVQADTFHSFCYAMINGYATRLGYRYPVNAYDEHLSSAILVDIMISRGLPHKNPAQNEKLRLGSAKVVRNALEKVMEKHPDQWIQIDDEYKRRLKAYNAVDYGQMITETIRLLRDNDGVRLDIHHRWRHFLVDEFQDTDPSQMELVDLIDPVNLFIIGDPDQSIYAFRSARPENINDIVKRDGCELIHLDINYRCAIKIIERSNQLIESVENQFRVPAKARGDAGNGFCVAARSFNGTWAHAASMAKNMLESGKYKPSDIAILCRDNGREYWPVGCYGVCEALKGLGIPFKRIVRDGSLWDSYEVRNVIYTLMLILNPSDKGAWGMAVNFPFNRASKSDRIEIKKKATFERMTLLEACEDINENLTAWAETIGLIGDGVKSCEDATEILDMIVSIMGWRTHFEKLTGRRFHYLIEMMKHQMRQLESEGYGGLVKFIEWWVSRETIREPQSVNAVEVSTIHSYKGLEKPIIIIPGVSGGQFPKMSKKNLNLDEETRILYVGITRAEEQCQICYEGEPSPFLETAGFFKPIDENEMQEEFFT